MTFADATSMLDWHGIDVDVMDCAADNLAVLLRFCGAGDVRAPFACEWHVGLAASGELLLERRSADSWIRELTGFTLRSALPGADGFVEACAEHVLAGTPVLVYGDAYFLPWLPYVGTAHMEHTFLLTAVADDHRTFAVTDAYDNVTPWGQATPVRTYLDAFGLHRAVAELRSPNAGKLVTIAYAGPPALPDWTGVLATNAREVARATHAGVLSSYAERHRTRLDDPGAVAQVTVDCWLAHRRRALHGRWLAELGERHPDLIPSGFPAQFDASVTAAWRRARDFAYIAQRRAEQGRRAPATALDMIADEIEQAEARLAAELRRHVAAAQLAGSVT